MFETQIPVCSIVLVLTVTKYKFYLNLTKLIFCTANGLLNQVVFF